LAQLRERQLARVFFIIEVPVLRELFDNPAYDLGVCPVLFQQPLTQLAHRTRLCGKQLDGAIHRPILSFCRVLDDAFLIAYRILPSSPHSLLQLTNYSFTNQIAMK